MVNEQKNIKNEILKALYLAGGATVSGVELSDCLNISRVAVWKHITGLKESGFDIESRPMGYGLLNHEDLLAPFCFKKKFQNRIFLFQVIESTMDRARALAKTAAPHLSAVIAENQTLGRGRLNRKWFSSKGGLWFTLILKPNTPPVLAYIYNFAASLSLSLCLRRLFDLDVRVKWPNDLLLNGQKLAGLLSEMETRGDMVEFINIGIGMNVNNHPKTYEPNAVSLTEILGKNISRRLILENFLDEFENRIQSIDCNHIIDQWKTRTSTIGTRVRIETLTEVHEGLAVDVDETGALIIEDWGGRTQRIIYGDCFYA